MLPLCVELSKDREMVRQCELCKARRAALVRPRNQQQVRSWPASCCFFERKQRFVSVLFGVGKLAEHNFQIRDLEILCEFFEILLAFV